VFVQTLVMLLSDWYLLWSLISFISKANCHDITELLLEVILLNIHNLNCSIFCLDIMYTIHLFSSTSQTRWTVS
jgi:hypothetical protein